MRRRFFLAAAAFCAVCAAPWTFAAAQDSLLTGTLKTIHDRGTILIGVRDSSC